MAWNEDDLWWEHQPDLVTDPNKKWNGSAWVAI